jgi:hypothetical protein
MIRISIAGLILLVAQAVPAFAERITLKCTNPAGNSRDFTFDTSALTVTVEESQGLNLFVGGIGGTFPIRMTEATVTWQNHSNIDPGIPGKFDPRENWSFTYHRDTAKLDTYQAPGPHGPGGTLVSECVRLPPGPM